MKIGILQTGLAPPDLAQGHGEYPKMFAQLLDGHGFDFDSWAVVNNVFPNGPEDADGWLITGSKHGAYEDHDWIAPLEALIRDIYAQGRPLVGVCFGHQIIAQALGGTVEKFDGGWAIGPQTYEFADGKRTVNAWHQDQVITAPQDAKVVASNDFCRNAALLYGTKAYTVQPHPEFKDGFIDGLIKTRGKGVVPDPVLAKAADDLGTPLQRDDIGAQFARFFKTGHIT